jgi:hypothetical protein
MIEKNFGRAIAVEKIRCKAIPITGRGGVFFQRGTNFIYIENSKAIPITDSGSLEDL